MTAVTVMISPLTTMLKGTLPVANPALDVTVIVVAVDVIAAAKAVVAGPEICDCPPVGATTLKVWGMS